MPPPLPHPSLPSSFRATLRMTAQRSSARLPRLNIAPPLPPVPLAAMAVLLIRLHSTSVRSSALNTAPPLPPDTTPCLIATPRTMTMAVVAAAPSSTVSTRDKPEPLIASTSARGPTMLTDCRTIRLPLVSAMVPAMLDRLMTSPGAASEMAWRSEPVPASASDETSMTAPGASRAAKRTATSTAHRAMHLRCLSRSVSFMSKFRVRFIKTSLCRGRIANIHCPKSSCILTRTTAEVKQLQSGLKFQGRVGSGID